MLRRLGFFGLALVLWCSGPASLRSEEKLLRLRNQIISTPSATQLNKAPQAQGTAPGASGLFLIQFNNRLEPAWRDQLQTMGVTLLRYVPDDGFVARLRNASLDQVAALPFIRWTGEYRAEYKIHAAVRTSLNAAPGKGSEVAVSVLLSSDASALAIIQARRAFARPPSEAKWPFGRILRGNVKTGEMAALLESSAVLWIEPAFHPKLHDEIASKIVGGDDGLTGTRTVTQELGFDGSGVTVAVADSGLDSGDPAMMHPDLAGRVDAFFQYGSLTDASDGHGHGTHVAGIVAGNAATGEADENGYLYGLGVAPGAHLVAQRVFDPVGNDNLPANKETLTRDAVRAGAVIGSNSWGDDVQGRYDLNASEFDALVRDADRGTPGDQPYILEFSAGNAGPGAQTLDSPAVAKNVIATGAAENDRFDFFIYADGEDTMADFSSRGPCEDGRIKPDVVAPGTWIASLQSQAATDENAWLPIDNYYQYEGGTSQSGPHASGAAAVFVQYYRQTHGNVTPSPALVKAALINSAVDMDDSAGTGPVPNNDEGWGRIDLTEIIGSSRAFVFIDQTNLLTTGQVFEQRVVVANVDQPLKVTLAYTDVPGFPAALPALVNDLDLEVVAPDGRVYRGNQFDGGESVPDAPTADSINNVEGVHFRAAAVGEYIVRVRARNVVEDALANTPAVDQDFALVVSGDLPAAGVGVLFFDRAAYRAPDAVNVKLIDPDLAGRSSINVAVTSLTEPNGESLTLFPAGALGSFTNRIATVTGSSNGDGVLQVRNGDTIQASYQDATPSATRTATARIDLVPPVLTSVSATNQFGKVFIRWASDEPATSIVRYGTNDNVLLAVTNSLLTATHEIALDKLATGASYKFFVVSADEAGNAATNNNGGALFSFVAASAKTLLLVDAYRPADPMFNTTDIPITAYTAPLDQTGVNYDVWDVSVRGTPGTNDLRPFRVVIWRLNDNPLTDDTIDPAQQSTLQSYVNNGGSLFISSMELLSRIGDVPFRTNVLQVQAFNEDVGVESANGAAGDVIANEMGLPLDYTAYDSDLLRFLEQSPDVADTLSISGNAVPIFYDTSSGQVAGLRYPRTGSDSGGRVVFLSFPFDAVSESDPSPDNRATLLRNILNFLAPGANGLGTLALDSSAYTLPSLVTIELGDSDLSGKGQATVTARTTTATNGLSVGLFETPQPGVFRGSFVLVNATNAPAPGQLRAKNGDMLTVEYFDTSAGSSVTATASVDTVPAIITNVGVTPDYESAEVSWDTSKPTDALVQFWETSGGFPRNRTAYQNEQAESHFLTMSSLLPDHSYSFQVVSRDAAGNTTVDDNHGQYYTFRTLQPITPPWTDDLNNGGSAWTVIDGEDTQQSWQLGVPNNGWETEAQSPPNAWGSNLNGDGIDYVESFLVSPAIDLTGGNTATLHFSHSYDFLSDPDAILEGGEVLLVVNNTVASLAGYSSDATSWTEETLDLTPYLGHVIYLAWHYVYFSLESAPRPGWLVDDVSVTVGNTVRGTIVITNNLSQAKYTVSGPISETGQGLGLTLSNMPLGQYVVTFDPVPYYQAPAPQTNQVTSATPVVFQGAYTFTDANHNGIADAWEQQYFGGVSPDRTQVTDSDGDGVSDYAEFIGGTNPTNTTSRLELGTPAVQNNGNVHIEWPSVAGYAYRVEGSSDAIIWTPLSDWMRASGNLTSFNWAGSSNNATFLFRLTVRP